MNYKARVFYTIAFLLTITLKGAAQDYKQDAQGKKTILKELVEEANAKGINTLKEQTTIRTAEIFLGYADWDENNVAENTTFFSQVTKYKDYADYYAEQLPTFERKEIVEMLDSAIAEIKAVMNGEIKRLPTPDVDWSKVTLQNDMLVYDNKPVFLNDWTWKPQIDDYCRYHGNLDGYYITPKYVINESGNVAKWVISDLKDKEDGSIGSVFLNHNILPSWAAEKDSTITDGCGANYVMYDINNPLSRKIYSSLLANTVPLMAGKKYTQLGYMLCNEPHWNTVKNEWASNEISELAYKEFLAWLKKKHETIDRLNQVWHTSYKSFDVIDVPRIREASEQGTPLYFDFMSFNMDRVTEWFSFLAGEVKKYDPQAKTHIKLMPNLWSDGVRDSGIDMEALTRNSDIIGNDASTCGAWMWGAPQEWEASYNYNWTEIAMAYDFYKSVSPGKIIYNSEGHMLSTGKYRNLFEKPEYARNNYWLATIHGLTATQTWYWARREDGSCRPGETNGYAGSNNHQPRIVNEVHTTMLDLNSVSDKIMEFQRQNKALRIFYSKASAINSQEYMDEIFKTYESMYFDGIPLGFATEGIIENNDNDWSVIVVSQTPQVYNADITALQKYIDNGGVVIVDGSSLLTDEYGQPLKASLKSSKGRVITVSGLDEMKNQAYSVLQEADLLPPLKITDNNGLSQKGCSWRVIKDSDGGYILNLVNLSKNPTTIDVSYSNSSEKVTSMTNVLTGQNVNNSIKMGVNDVLLLKLNPASSGVQDIAEGNEVRVFATGSMLHVASEKIVSVKVYDCWGRMVASGQAGTGGGFAKTLQPGLYMVKAGRSTSKILIR